MPRRIGLGWHAHSRSPGHRVFGVALKGARNAPNLDGTAWYSGNSGVGFELSSGSDATAWAEKQYDFSKAGSHPVKGKRPNAWGLYDMLGNVAEWCGDFWIDSYPGGPRVDPQGPAHGVFRAVRGGSWDDRAWYVRAPYRFRYMPSDRLNYIGFRIARSASDEYGQSMAR